MPFRGFLIFFYHLSKPYLNITKTWSKRKEDKMKKLKRRLIVKLNHRFWKLGGTAISLALLILSAFPGLAAITPVDPYRAEALADPSPAVFTFQSSIAYYNNFLIYAGNDGKIYAYNIDTGTSTLVSDTSSLSTAFSAVQGFVVSSGNYLYFHDNAVTSNIYRVLLTETWPAQFETLDTQVSSDIFAFTENPWTNTIWFSSSDFFGSGNNLYLHEVNSEFTGVTLNLSFAQPNGGGNGPIIFENETTVLYGEAVFGGYFHQVNTDTGAIKENYITFSGGLVDATAGYNNHIYVTSGSGKAIFEIDGNQKTQLATTHDEASGITFDGTSFFISAMVPSSGEVSLLQLWLSAPPEEQIAEILDFIDASVAEGTLAGSGPGNSAQNRLNALINMIEASGDLIEAGDIDQACGQLMAVHRKCDGESPPPDFVEGDAAAELAQMILNLIASLGC
jgi:hypothetical protein